VELEVLGDYAGQSTRASLIICLLLLLGCGRDVSKIVAPPSSPSAPVIMISPPTSDLLGGQSTVFTATMNDTASGVVDWLVNGAIGGTPEFGLISGGGEYTAPAHLNASVTVAARLRQNIAVESSATVSVISPINTNGQISFVYSLPENARTSAGIYDNGQHLVRTIWSNQTQSAGPHVGTWNGLDDNGNGSNLSQYTVKLLYNNVTYDWGLIGNTSASYAGPNNWDTQATFPLDAAAAGATVFTANGYAEGRPNASSFAVADPQSPQALFNFGETVMLQFAASDGDRVYYGNVGNGWNGSTPFILSYDIATKQQYHFPDGFTVANGGYPLSGVIDIDPNAGIETGSSRTHLPTGIAVQQSGVILAVSHGTYYKDGSPTLSPGDEKISLFNKLSGAHSADISIHDPQRLAFSPNGDLWVISANQVIKFTAVGESNIASLQLAGLVKPLAIAVDPSTSDVLVADGGSSQQVKRFSSGGLPLTTYGQLGGYSDCNPSVGSDRLYLDSTAGGGAGNQAPATWLTVLKDGSFWVGDLGNDRALHISSTGAYLEQFTFLTDVYSVTADHEDPTRVFGDFLEYKVDYSKDLLAGDPDPSKGGNGSWALSKNWSVCVPSQYISAFERVRTFASGRTYAEVLNGNIHSQITGGDLLELVELPAEGGIRFTGQILADGGWNKYIDNNGDLTFWEDSLTPAGDFVQTAYRQQFISENQAGPVWDLSHILASVPGGANPNATLDPLGFGGWGMTMFPSETASGYLPTYNTGATTTPGSDFHLGAVHLGNADWSWKTSRGEMLAVPDNQGTFTDVPAFGGHEGIAALVEANNIIEGYDGQYGTFSSQWMHWTDDGLLIGQFGHPASGYAPNGSLFPGAAGNIASMVTISIDGQIYMYNSDESYHTGIHRWAFVGLSTIKELSAVATLGSVVTMSQSTVIQK
jgi:hypothetical protein